MFDSIQKSFGSAIKKLRGKSRMSEAEVDEVLADIRVGLLEADVHFRVVRDFLARVKERCLREEVLKSLTPEQQVLKVLSEELTSMLGGNAKELDFSVKPPAVILVCGLQGSGKTTSLVKLALHLKNKNKRVLVVSTDVRRPAALEQLKQLSDRNGIDGVYLENQAQLPPLKIAENALKIAQETNIEVLLVDTAGRVQLDDDLMNELQSLTKALNPTERLLVIDSMMGQSAVDVAEGFKSKVDLTGAILTKLDGDARGGAALSLVSVTGKPIKFIGTGERATDFEIFYPERISSRLLDMGDVLSLLERAEEALKDEGIAKEEMAEGMLKGSFTLEDFRNQLRMVSKMGSMGSLMKMLPGMGSIQEQFNEQEADKEFKKINAILGSMTQEERKQPQVINGSRRSRISKGSGVAVQEINSFLKRFDEARRMMKKMGKWAKYFGGAAGGGGAPAGLDPFMSKRNKGFGRKL
jgi:signal recognition particle subunit SRP54